MNKMKYLYTGLILICVSFFMSGCQTTDSDRIDLNLPELDYPTSDTYTLDTSSIKEPDAPNFFFMVVDENGGLRTAGDNETPTHVVMLQEDLNKIEAMLDVKTAYKDISKEQESLINIERQKSNALIDMLKLERQSRILERNLRFEVEELYKRERRDHKFDNIINRATMIVAVIGGIAVCAL